LRVLVLGGGGFLGSYVTDLLISKGVETHVLVSGFRSKNHPNLIHKDALIEKGNLLNPSDLESATKGADIVFHLGAVASHYCDAMPELAFDVNVKGTWNLKKACRQNRVKRIFFASTSFVYGDPKANPVKENAPLEPKGNYEVTKLAGERILQAVHPFQVPYTILRLFNVYGPRSYPDKLYSQAVTTFIIAALKGQSLEVHADGKQNLDFIYVKDAARAFWECVNCNTKNRIFNVGSGKSTSINELSSTINKLTNNQTKIHYNPAHPAYLNNVRADITSISECTEWTPKYNLAEGLKETIEFFRAVSL